MLLGVGQRDYANSRALPDIVKVELSNRDVELAAQTILQATQNLALVLQGAGVGNVQFKRQQTNWHSNKRLMLRSLAPAELLASAGTGLRGSFGTRELRHTESFENIANLDVIEIRDAHAALEARANFAGVVFEALERAEF
jgi:hypothetical protein